MIQERLGMRGYVLAHWRGTLPLATSFLVNGVLLYLAFIAVLLGLAALGYAINTPVVLLLVPFGLALFAVYFVWALVGIFRCGIGIAFARKTPPWRRMLGGGAVIASLVVSIGALNDLRRF